MERDWNGSLSVTGRDLMVDRDFKVKLLEIPAGHDRSGLEEGVKRRRETKRRRTREDTGSDYESQSESESGDERKRRGRRKSEKKPRRRKNIDDDDYSDSYSDSESDYLSEYSDSAESESEEEMRRRKRKERKKKEKQEEKRRRRKKEKRRMRREKEEEREMKRRKRKKEKKKGKLERGKKGAVTNSWGKYGIIRETDMWNKRPEFTAWLAEVKLVNLESLPAWEEKQMFKDFMEDHNTATFPSKKYYNIDAYYKRQMEKERKKGFKKIVQTERTVFNDEEQRRLELQQARERQKEEEVQALKRSMQSGMAQAMREQARLREEMAYLYKIGNNEAAAAIQKRLEPDVPM